MEWPLSTRNSRKTLSQRSGLVVDAHGLPCPMTRLCHLPIPARVFEGVKPQITLSEARRSDSREPLS